MASPLRVDSAKPSASASKLLEDAPDKVAVLRRFTERLRPSSGWSGSLAGIIESPALLLRAFEVGSGGTELAAFARKERERLRGEAERTRTCEPRSFRRRSETFE